eukprot:1230959-Pleurochrysis_carterae.AAC.1
MASREEEALLAEAGAKYLDCEAKVRKMLDSAEMKALNAGFVDLEGAMLDKVIAPLLVGAIFPGKSNPVNERVHTFAYESVYDFFKYKLNKENMGEYKITDPTVWMEHAKTFKPANVMDLHDWPRHVQEMCESTQWVHCSMDELQKEMKEMKALLPHIWPL